MVVTRGETATPNSREVKAFRLTPVWFVAHAAITGANSNTIAVRRNARELDNKSAPQALARKHFSNSANAFW
jgi:hypothetical protein